MKKILLIGLVSLSLAGCQGFPGLEKLGQSVLSGGLSITAPVQNPVTRMRLRQLEDGATVAVAGLVTYRRACIAGAADAGCVARIESIQVYTRKLQALLPQIRRFVKNNDQVSAMQVYSEAQEALTSLKAEAAQAKARGV